MRSKLHIKSFFLLVCFVTMFFSSVYAEQLDPIFDSILTAQEEQLEGDASFDNLAKMYGAESNKQYQTMQKQMKEYEERRDAAEAERTTKRLLAFVLSLMIALFPTVVIVKRVISGELQPADKAAVWRTVGMLLFCGIVLFGLNYAWLWCLFTGQTKIMGAVLGLCLFAFVLFAIHTLRKSKKSNDTTNSPTR